MTALLSAFTMGPARGWALFALMIVVGLAAAVAGEVAGRGRR